VQVAFADPDLLSRFEVVVDHDAEPSDLDEALAEFLLKIVHKRRSAVSPAAELSFNIIGETEDQE